MIVWKRHMTEPYCKDASPYEKKLNFQIVKIILLNWNVMWKVKVKVRSQRYQTSVLIIHVIKETITIKILHDVSMTSCHHCQLWRNYQKRHYIYRKGVCVNYKNVNNEMRA